MRDRHQSLSAKGLHKKYGKQMVVTDVDVSVERGEICLLYTSDAADE